MYLITAYNGGVPTVIHEGGNSSVKVEAAKISREVNKFDSLSFSIYPNNPGWDAIKPFSTTITVANTRTGKVEFDGRVLAPVPRMDSDGTVYREVVCEGLMAFLCDSQQRYAEDRHYEGSDGLNGLQEYLKLLLDVHNAAVEPRKQIQLGEVTLKTFDTSEGVTKGIARDSTWANIEDKLIGTFGGEMRVRRDAEGVLRLDYAERLGTDRATVIEVGRNMVDGSREIDYETVITRLYPYGAKKKIVEIDDEGNETEVETEERLGIEDVNGGLPYIDDEVAMKEYGIIEGSNEWDDVTQPQNLLDKARKWLGGNNTMQVANTFSAIDLSMLGLDIDAFNIHDSYICRNPLIGVDERLEVVKQTVDISDPGNSSISMGDSSYLLSGGVSDTESKLEDLLDFKDQAQTEIGNVGNSVRTTYAAIKVASDAIRSTVSEEIKSMNETIQKVTEMLQSPEGWDFIWKEMEQQIDDKLGTQQRETLKYIKFIDGEIWLGRDPDPGQSDFKAVISNERIKFLENNIEVAYISNQQLYVTNASVTNRFDIGLFSWMPRSNGNTTLRFMG